GSALVIREMRSNSSVKSSASLEESKGVSSTSVPSGSFTSLGNTTTPFFTFPVMLMHIPYFQTLGKARRLKPRTASCGVASFVGMDGTRFWPVIAAAYTVCLEQAPTQEL